MRVSCSWLREFVSFEITPAQLGDRLTMQGLEVEDLFNPFAALEHVVVGRVLTREPHPQAEKLSVCTVDVGQAATLTIVCGAPNVAAGQVVPVALPGAVLPNGMAIKPASLRGVPSQGMICSETELGLGEGKDGILVLDGDAAACAPGTPLATALRLDTEVFEIGITPNRADCLSHLGVAREAALALGLPVTLPGFSLAEDPARPAAPALFAVEIPEPALCPVYQGRVISGVHIGKSPAWLRYRLIALGLRPISNLVDVTNYVMMEVGQPLHAFDMDLLAGGKIRVARAEAGMQFVTLDGQTRTLTGDDLCIWDGDKPVGLAGVMGGANSEVHDGTTNIFLESAVFRPGTIRRTGRRLSLSSEAGYRFERGVDQPGSRFALDRAAALMTELGGGVLHPGVAVAEPAPWINRRIRFRPARARMLLGVDVTDDFCRTTLQHLGCQVDEHDAQSQPGWTVTAPSHRVDLEREADIVEEVGRVHGLDRIPGVVPAVSRQLDAPRQDRTPFAWTMRTKHWAQGCGLLEAINFSFFGHKDLDRFHLPVEHRVSVLNPLSEEQDALRTALAPGLLYSLKVNLSQGVERVRLFEVAKAFFKDPASETTVREESRLGLLLYGPRDPDCWPYSRDVADYQDLKGLTEHLLETLGLPAAGFARQDDHPYLSPAVAVTVQGEYVGALGRVQPEIAKEYHARQDVWLAELELDVLARLAAGVLPAFQALPVFPASKRDITIAAPAGLAVQQLLDAARGAGSSILEDVVLVDRYLPAGNDGPRNWTLRFTFRHPAKTLKDKDVDKEMERLGAVLQQEATRS
ncbi:phenylalanine--tRNA ligase subunit beta [Megalodesulfovibrio gigas]|uniref:Phenylalanine--tRNA ligase beta subunit n=1 Tax=Megalodesulfovibrio gigas (strain ATCC 19364 / DSM 1382 / NCIMB 9332 / VKM B-1759) TaxID=1121448 RepID=T2GA94_MEGG1|nr:phenylalanine--tRNA ligase subunit beta [Megalodesulfovibrio gigas]AGW13203.1 putative phenylalanyl-tRNA synthetase subunit beta [Megalodesulfovibrio gigas DSM 1382 = ATCC 19364]